MQPRTYQLGDLKLTLVHDGIFRLDGGAMFGVVPKTLWSKGTPADELNRIEMVTNCLLVERGNELLLVDTAIGDKNDAKFRSIYAMDEHAVRLPEAIERAGYELGDVTHVLLSHLHFDHCGWNTRVDAAGRLVPTFPRARYWLQRGEVACARQPNERDRASYDGRNWEPLFEAGIVELFDEEGEPIAGVKAVRTPGHNDNMCIVLLDGTMNVSDKTVSNNTVSANSGPASSASRFTRGAFWADLVPTSAHVPFAWIMGYDLYPLQTLEAKKHWLPLAAAEGWLSIFEHDPGLPLGRLVEERPGRFKAQPIT